MGRGASCQAGILLRRIVLRPSPAAWQRHAAIILKIGIYFYSKVNTMCSKALRAIFGNSGGIFQALAFTRRSRAAVAQAHAARGAGREAGRCEAWACICVPIMLTRRESMPPSKAARPNSRPRVGDYAPNSRPLPGAPL